MSVSADEIAAQSDKDHSVRDVDALLVVAHEAAPSYHPAEGALDNSAAGQDFEKPFWSSDLRMISTTKSRLSACP